MQETTMHTECEHKVASYVSRGRFHTPPLKKKTSSVIVKSYDFKVTLENPLNHP